MSITRNGTGLFARYLARPAISPKLTETLRAILASEDLGKGSRAFNGLNYPPSEETTYEMVKSLIGRLTNSLFCRPKDLEAWLNKATRCAINDLFDENGDFRTDFINSMNTIEINKQGGFDLLIQCFHDRIDALKKQFLISYLVSIITEEATSHLYQLQHDANENEKEKILKSLEDDGWYVVDRENIESNVVGDENSPVTKFSQSINRWTLDLMRLPTICEIMKSIELEAQPAQRP